MKVLKKLVLPVALIALAVSFVYWWGGLSFDPATKVINNVLHARSYTPTPMPAGTGPNVADLKAAADDVFNQTSKLEELKAHQANISFEATEVANQIATQQAIVTAAVQNAATIANSFNGTPMPATPTPTATPTP